LSAVASLCSRTIIFSNEFIYINNSRCSAPFLNSKLILLMMSARGYVLNLLERLRGLFHSGYRDEAT